jgi:hypothetical protein
MTIAVRTDALRARAHPPYYKLKRNTMKTKWRFFFETTDFIFEKEHKFRGSIPKDAVSSSGIDIENKIEFEMSIVPDKEQKHPSTEQTGTMYITIPFTYEEGKEIVKGIAYLLVQRISFDFGDMKLNTGLIMCERLPETHEEIELVGDRPFAAEVSLEEVVPPPTFNAKKLSDHSHINMDTRLVAQHNSAKKSKNPIEKFLGFFKIIETLFGPHSKNVTLKDALLENKSFFDLFKNVFQYDAPDQYKKEYVVFVDKIVKGRHKCAHMRLKKDFGYWASDPRVKDEIEPFIEPLEALSYYAIRGV